MKVRDLPLMARFYERVMRLRRTEERKDGAGKLRAVWLALGPTQLVLEMVPSRSSEPGSRTTGLHLVALQIDIEDREPWKEHLRKHGVRVVDESLWSIFFNDPEGNRLAVTHYPDPWEGDVRSR